MPLEIWISTGPGPRAYVGFIAARKLPARADVPPMEIPQDYHNRPEARALHHQGLLACP